MMFRLPRFILDGFQDDPKFIEIRKCLFLFYPHFLHNADKTPGMLAVSPVNPDNIALHAPSFLMPFPLEGIAFLRSIFIFPFITYHMIGYRLVTDSGVRKYFFRESGELKNIPSISCSLERCMYDNLTFTIISKRFRLHKWMVKRPYEIIIRIFFQITM